ncbi:hypothetical protein Anapl_17392 [Anas platyrhynchos]|uniref:Uncharacterized protein n=1 Tax=Anas platyrhynchos TaxID=8839 RepID=R0JC96_ANAPL|nr:hypothetical protein Anapl_17392 [Anas platyrhynchos]
MELLPSTAGSDPASHMALTISVRAFCNIPSPWVQQLTPADSYRVAKSSFGKYPFPHVMLISNYAMELTHANITRGCVGLSREGLNGPVDALQTCVSMKSGHFSTCGFLPTDRAWRSCAVIVSDPINRLLLGVPSYLHLIGNFYPTQVGGRIRSPGPELSSCVPQHDAAGSSALLDWLSRLALRQNCECQEKPFASFLDNLRLCLRLSVMGTTESQHHSMAMCPGPHPWAWGALQGAALGTSRGSLIQQQPFRSKTAVEFRSSYQPEIEELVLEEQCYLNSSKNEHDARGSQSIRMPYTDGAHYSPPTQIVPERSDISIYFIASIRMPYTDGAHYSPPTQIVPERSDNTLPALYASEIFIHLPSWEYKAKHTKSIAMQRVLFFSHRAFPQSLKYRTETTSTKQQDENERDEESEVPEIGTIFSNYVTCHPINRMSTSVLCLLPTKS